jgi:hypothetical protein
LTECALDAGENGYRAPPSGASSICRRGCNRGR